MVSSDETSQKVPTQLRNLNRPRPTRCRFFNTSGGCRAAESCPFAHVPAAEGSVEKVQRRNRRTPRNAGDEAVDAKERPGTVDKPEERTSNSSGSQAPSPENRQERPSGRSRQRTRDKAKVGASKSSIDAPIQPKPGVPGANDNRVRSTGQEQTPAASGRNANLINEKVRDAPKRTLGHADGLAEAPRPFIGNGIEKQDGRQERRKTPQQRTPVQSRPAFSRPVVSRPGPAAKLVSSDVRSSEISQLERRFRSSYQVQNTLPDGSITVSFDFHPTDPDFVFDLDGDVVKCQLHIPSSYPSSSSSLKIGNAEIPKGLARNVETGFDNQARAAAQLQMADPKRPTLLAQTKWLDRNLESLLSAPPSSTVTFVRHEKRTGPPVLSNVQKEQEATSATILRPEAKAFVPQTSPTVPRSSAETRSFHNAQTPPKTSPRRDRELGQIERRFNESFKLISDTHEETVVRFTIMPSESGVSHNIQTLQLALHIPKDYPSKLPSIRVLESDLAADILQNMEDAFKRYASLSVPKEKLTIQFLLNRLDRDLSMLIHREPVSDRLIMRRSEEATEAEPIAKENVRDVVRTTPKSQGVSGIDAFAVIDDEMSRVTLRPPYRSSSDRKEEPLHAYPQTGDTNAAWPVRSDGESGIESGEESQHEHNNESEEGSENEIDDGSFLSAVAVNAAESGSSTSTRNSSQISAAPAQPNIVGGIEIRLPDIILERVATLECSSISLQLRCGRCKNNVEIKGLTPMDNTKSSSRIYCNTCGSEGHFGFHKEILHPSHLKLGRLIIQGFLPTDLHPSSYISTCESCSTPSPSPHRSVAVGQPVSFNCRSCHCKMMFQIQTVRFTRIGGGDVIADGKSGPEEMRRKVKKVKEPGLIVGQPLPDLGTCKHYRKSHRWLRFPCCGKLYPCDVCHETTESHISPTLATRMVCGYCSREQPFSQKPCICGRSTTEKKSTSGYWEGGSGTRDRSRMNRNDGRKYQGLHKTQSKKGVSVPKKANENEVSRAED